MTNRCARTLAIVTLALALPLVALIVVRSGDDSGSRSRPPVSAPAGTPAPA